MFPFFITFLFYNLLTLQSLNTIFIHFSLIRLSRRKGRQRRPSHGANQQQVDGGWDRVLRNALRRAREAWRLHAGQQLPRLDQEQRLKARGNRRQVEVTAEKRTKEEEGIAEEKGVNLMKREEGIVVH